MASEIPNVDEELESCSQHSNYSMMFGEEDITDLIVNYSTQPIIPISYPPHDTAPPKPPGLQQRKDSDLSTEPASQASGPPESSIFGPSLGKRKASDTLASEGSRGPFRPLKQQRGSGSIPSPPAEANEDGDSVSENPYRPISFSPPKTLQGMFNAKRLPYGVQYEIARYVSRGMLQYKDFLIPWVDQLSKSGKNQDSVPALKHLLAQVSFEIDEEPQDDFESKFAKERASRSPWMELDREEEALGISPYGGLGFNDKGEHLDWHGGQVLFSGKLLDKAAKGCKKPVYKLILKPAELAPSTMFARRFGSKHFFRVKLTKNVCNKNVDDLMEYLRRPLILCGSVFRAFYAKDSNVFYVKTNEPNDGTSITDGDPVPDVLSFLEFLEWHNPMEHNENQTMAKWASRFTLGLSDSVPGIRIEQKDIKFIKDIVSPSGSNMTDGAGMINRWSLNQLRHRLGWDDKPTAIQIRIFGSKGLLVDDGKHAEESTYVELTPSQQKIMFPIGVEMDPAHRIVDVLRASHFKTPCRLSVETIINLAENGVKKEVFLQLLQTSLAELVDPLMDWKSENASLRIWAIVCRLGGVMGRRRAREQVALARVLGYSDKDTDEVENDDDDDDETTPAKFVSGEQSIAWWGDEVSGCPASMEETMLCLLDSGFTFQDCSILREHLLAFLKHRINTYIRSYKIDVPMSASAFLVPDTLGILEPGEVFFRSSKRQFITTDGLESDIVVGDVLVTRHPCKLPTDIQKWKSVDKPELYHLLDVIVLSTKGDRRAADYLGGGDYDGDKGTFIWQPSLVDPFKNAPLAFADPPTNIKTFFSRENEEVVAFRNKTKHTSTDNQIRQLQNALLGAVRAGSVVGKYSTYHDIAIYTLGYRHRETIRLAYMFCMSLDGIKSGMTVDKQTLSEDSKKYAKRPPIWKETEDDKIRYANEKHITRHQSLGKFIMDSLCRQAEQEGDTWKIKLEKSFKAEDLITKYDAQLSAPWLAAVALSRRHKEDGRDVMEKDLEKIKRHVEALCTEHRVLMSAGSPRKSAFGGSPKKNGSASSEQPVRQDKLRALSQKFASGPPLKDLFMLEEEVARLKASYAYYHDFQIRKSRFPFQMAMRELCTIKARAQGRQKTVSGDFYDHFTMKAPKTLPV